MVRRSIVLKAALLHGRNASGALPVNETQTCDFKHKGDLVASALRFLGFALTSSPRWISGTAQRALTAGLLKGRIVVQKRPLQPKHVWSIRQTKVAQIYGKTGNLRAVQLVLGHTKMDSTVRYLGVDLDGALTISEGIDL